MKPEENKTLTDAIYKAWEPHSQFTKSLEECTLPLDELFDKAIEEAENRYMKFKAGIDSQFKLYPLNKIDILREAASKLRNEEINHTWLGDGRTNREELINFLARFYGNTDDGKTLYRQIIDTFRSKWSHEYLTLLTNNELDSEAVTSYQPKDLYKGAITQQKQEISNLKAAAIIETIELFRDKHKYEADYNTLLDVLNQNKYDNLIKYEIDLNAKYIKTGYKEERAKEIHSCLATIYNAKGKIEFNEGYVVSNSGALSQSKLYCEYAFWELFHTAQLERMQGDVASQPDTKYTTQKEQTEDNPTYLEPDLLLTIHTKFNGKLWDNVSGARFISVFTYDSKATLNVKDDKKELVCGLLKRMYDNSNTHLNKKDWAKPLLDKLNLSQSTFDGINNKLLGKKYHEQTRAQRPFMKDLNIVLPPKANPTY